MVPQRDVWKTFARALDAEPRDDLIVRGASGLEHPVQGLAVDDKGGRVIVVSSEPSPRVAALMQIDVQTAFPGSRVLVARPVVFDLGTMARSIFPSVRAARIPMRRIARFAKFAERAGNARTKKYFEKQVEETFNSAGVIFSHVALPAFVQISDVIQQLAHLDWAEFFENVGDEKNGVISFQRLREVDNLAVDRAHGICPVPLYEFGESDWSIFESDHRTEDAKERLKALGIYQYFFPPADQIALGAIDLGANTATNISSIVTAAPTLGHPLGELELVDKLTDIPALLDDLSSRKYVAEADLGFEVTPEGRTVRGSVKIRPREGLIVKLLQRVGFNVNVAVSPKDFFPPGTH